jgi:catechol 2,3-dioxygenase-like lactoylglutathione lyase family enzyme
LSIFDHIAIQVAYAGATSAFYRAALAPLAIDQKFLVERAGGTVAGFGREQASFFVKEGAANGPGHIAFMARSREEVGAFHAAALAAGGQDNGAPGFRPKYHDRYYAAFVIDPAGNNVEAVFHG